MFFIVGFLMYGLRFEEVIFIEGCGSIDCFEIDVERE